MEERRYYGLDALRGGMMMLGIVLHSAELYLAAPPPQIPFPSDRNDSLVCDLLFHFIHAFRMPTFFVLAGFFSALLVEKRGLGATYKNRAARVLAPLAVGMVTIVPVTLLLMIDFMLATRYGSHQLWPDTALLIRLDREAVAQGAPPILFPAMHLWFLIYLCYFYLLLPLCRRLAELCRRHERVLQKALGSPAAIVPLGLFTALTLLPYKGAQLLEGFIDIKPHLPSILYYGSFFVLGYLFRGLPALMQAAARHARTYGLLGVLLFVIALYASLLEYLSVQPSLAVHVMAALANAFCTWALIYFFIGAALRWFDFAATWILYASQSSYWVFLVHMPLVGIAGWTLVPWDAPGLVKFALVVAFVSAVCLFSYHFLVQRSWVSVFLNGKRFNLPLPWK